MPQDAPHRAPSPRRKRAFTRNEDGGILVFWALFLAVAFGFAALTLDIGRVANTQSELQSFADQVALAAAGELDGRSGAITRATAAADGLISRSQTFGDGGAMMRGQGDYTLSFLSSLPANDRDPATATTTDPTRARFVQVSVNQRNVQTPFAAINATLVGRAGANAQAQVGAAAVAGNSGWACDITPLFFCVPSGWNAGLNIGQQIRLRAQGGSEIFWGPGNFGFLDLEKSLGVDPDGACGNLLGANLYRCLIGAETAITKCIETDAGFVTQPGQRQGLVRAFNTRFDIYDGPMNSVSNDSNYRPAPNVMSHRWTNSGGQGAGQGGGQGGGQVTVDPRPLLRDSCIRSSTECRFGQGDWDREGYLSLYHDGEWPLADDPNALARPARDKITRYDMYLAEIDAARARGNNDWPLTASAYERVGRPSNHSLARNRADRAKLNPARRTLIAAAVDCERDQPTGKDEVFPLEYVRVFMTEPVAEMGGDDRGEILVEVVESAGGEGSGSGAASGIYREVIQLYR